MNNVNDSYFDGFYKDIWKAIIPDILTERETEFMLKYFQLAPGKKLLDLMCGYGRHSIPLSRKGIQTTAVDNLQQYIDEIIAIQQTENLPLKAVCSSILDYDDQEMFNLVICMGNSLNFFDETCTQKILDWVSDHLLPGGSLLINSWSLAEIAIPSFTAQSNSLSAGMEYAVDAEFLFQPTRIEAKHLITTATGIQESKKAIDYIFSMNEMQNMIAKADLRFATAFSIPGKKQFSLGDPRVYFIATKD